MGYEIVEQLGWRVPSVIIYPTGGGTGLIGMWKAFQELEEMGVSSLEFLCFVSNISFQFIGRERPRMVAVQTEGCAPMVRAFEDGELHALPWEKYVLFPSFQYCVFSSLYLPCSASTCAAGLRVPAAIGDFLILRALRESHGTAVRVSEKELLEGVKDFAGLTGITQLDYPVFEMLIGFLL